MTPPLYGLRDRAVAVARRAPGRGREYVMFVAVTVPDRGQKYSSEIFARNIGRSKGKRIGGRSKWF